MGGANTGDTVSMDDEALLVAAIFRTGLSDRGALPA